MTPEEVAERFGAKPNGRGWAARCPCHDDAKPSLGIGPGRDGNVVVKCRAGCPTEQVLAAVGLDFGDLFASNGEVKPNGAPITYRYTDEHGALLFEVQRRPAPGGGKQFPQRRPYEGHWAWGLSAGWYRRRSDDDWRKVKREETPDPSRDRELPEVGRVLYRLPELLAAVPEEIVFLVEGEKDADNLRALGLTATCNPGGAGKWRSEFNVHLRGRQVVILPDNDPAGREHAEHVARELSKVAARVRFVKLPRLAHKGDVSDWLNVGQGHTKDELLSLVALAGTWAPSESKDAPSPATDYLVSLIEFAGDEEPDENDDADWLIRDLYPRGAPCLLAGPQKASKTIAALDSAIALVRGEDWLGLRNTAGPCRVLFMEQEDNVRRTRARLWWLCKARGIVPRDLDGRLVINAVDFWYPQRAQDEARMRRSMERFKPDITFVDSMRRSLVGNENASEIIAEFGRVWLELTRDFGTMCPLHHLRKNPGEGENLINQVRGSGDIVAIARHLVGIRRMPEDPNLRALEVDGNYTFGIEPFAFALVDGTDAVGKKTLRLEARGAVKGHADSSLDESIYDLLLAEGPLTATKIEEHPRLSGRADRIRASLRRLEAVGRVFRAGPRKPYVAAPRGTA